MENLNYENESMERKYLKMWKNQFLKVQNRLLEIEKDFIELKDIELKDINAKINRELKELFFEPIIVTTGDMDRFEKKETKKIRPI